MPNGGDSALGTSGRVRPSYLGHAKAINAGRIGFRRRAPVYPIPGAGENGLLRGPSAPREKYVLRGETLYYCVEQQIMR